ncbi:MFS transporter, PCFT/HCP family, solute carrier family 46 (folate transporter), member 1/3 [Mytilus galloprovincialis]|uniref:MFS transporter, PCFT/HCP family, solute carrier family 46 (Folate transporter), member 1/3 n=1 Tax=Mytilus galloprovincialis TaxID=29158 RepID=A0A8B6GMC3_MYTGA|nr:MFS transporter, PCFT/HCP family, solute carrier family 46 (folate transporter), member 1/3 [Mytilus galloprovincialis]
MLLFILLGLSISSPATTQFVYAYVKNHDFANNSTLESNQNRSKFVTQSCNANGTSDDKIQAIASDWSWYITLVKFGIAIPFIMFIGPMVDKIGRKKILLWNLSVLTISFAMKTVAIYFDLNLYYFLIGFAAEGLSGTYNTFHIASLSLLADGTSKGKERTIVMALYDALLGFGIFFSYISSGYLIEYAGFIYPFAISGGIVFFLLILVVITLQESWKNSGEAKTQMSISPGEIFSWCTRSENITSSVNYVFIYLLIFFIYLMPLSASSSIRMIYTLSSPFCWSAEFIGWFSGCNDIVVFVGGLIILKGLQICFKNITDELIVSFGFLSSIASLILYGLSKNNWMLYGAAAAGILQILPIPVIKAMLSRVVHPNKQGALFSNVYLIETVCQICAATLFNNIYHQTVTLYKGFVFFVMSGFPLLALIMMMIFVKCAKTPSKDQTEIVIERPDIQKSNIST